MTPCHPEKPSLIQPVDNWSNDCARHDGDKQDEYNLVKPGRAPRSKRPKKQEPALPKRRVEKSSYTVEKLD
jgi:hypothetical protein